MAAKSEVAKSDRPAGTFEHRTVADLVFHLRAIYGRRQRFFTTERPDGQTEAFSCEELMARVHALVAAFEYGRILRDSGTSWVVYGGTDKRDLLQEVADWLDPAPRLVVMDRYRDAIRDLYASS